MSPFPFLSRQPGGWSSYPGEPKARGPARCVAEGHAGLLVMRTFRSCSLGQSREGYFLEMCASPAGNFPGLDMGDMGIACRQCHRQPGNTAPIFRKDQLPSAEIQTTGFNYQLPLCVVSDGAGCIPGFPAREIRKTYGLTEFEGELPQSPCFPRAVVGGVTQLLPALAPVPNTCPGLKILTHPDHNKHKPLLLFIINPRNE